MFSRFRRRLQPMPEPEIEEAQTRETVQTVERLSPAEAPDTPVVSAKQASRVPSDSGGNGSPVISGESYMNSASTTPDSTSHIQSSGSARTGETPPSTPQGAVGTNAVSLGHSLREATIEEGVNEPAEAAKSNVTTTTRTVTVVRIAVGSCTLPCGGQQCLIYLFTSACPVYLLCRNAL